MDPQRDLGLLVGFASHGQAALTLVLLDCRFGHVEVVAGCRQRLSIHPDAGAVQCFLQLGHTLTLIAAAQRGVLEEVLVRPERTVHFRRRRALLAVQIAQPFFKAVDHRLLALQRTRRNILAVRAGGERDPELVDAAIALEIVADVVVEVVRHSLNTVDRRAIALDLDDIRTRRQPRHVDPHAQRTLRVGSGGDAGVEAGAVDGAQHAFVGAGDGVLRLAVVVETVDALEGIHRGARRDADVVVHHHRADAQIPRQLHCRLDAVVDEEIHHRRVVPVRYRARKRLRAVRLYGAAARPVAVLFLQEGGEVVVRSVRIVLVADDRAPVGHEQPDFRALRGRHQFQCGRQRAPQVVGVVAVARAAGLEQHDLARAHAAHGIGQLFDLLLVAEHPALDHEVVGARVVHPDVRAVDRMAPVFGDRCLDIGDPLPAGIRLRLFRLRLHVHRHHPMDSQPGNHGISGCRWGMKRQTFSGSVLAP